MNEFAKQLLQAASDIQQEVYALGLHTDYQEYQSSLSPQDKPIYDALRLKSEALANSYAQVKIDVKHKERLSWAGTAHEVREILTQMLRLLAPDLEVINRPWYKQSQDTKGPTQSQRARYILEANGMGSKQIEVGRQVDVLEKQIGDLIRATYSRASDAAHRFKGRTEVARLLRYFDAFACDLLSIKT
jgi:predicted pPIWI-associating nuclease